MSDESGVVLMGLFRRRSNDPAEDQPAVPVKPQPVDPASVDLGEAEVILTALVSAIGSDPKMRAALPRLVMASGMPHPDDGIGQYTALQDDPFVTTQVWRWLLAVALAANAAARYGISAKAGFWSFVWSETVAPNIQGSGFLGLGFDSAPPDTLRQVLEQAELGLARLPDHFVVARTAEPRELTAWLLRGELARSS